jgi:hypothetical protein
MGKAWVVCFLLCVGFVALNSHRAPSPTSQPQVHFDGGESADRCADPEACKKANEIAYKNVAANDSKAKEASRQWIAVSRQEAVIALTKRAVASALREPSSAVFKDVFYVRKKVGDAVCGEVNARNGFGGFTGMQPFVVTLPEGTLHLNSIPKWNRHCAG